MPEYIYNCSSECLGIRDPLPKIFHNIPKKIFQHLRGIPGIFIEGTPHVWVKFWHGTPHQLCVSNSKLANFGDPHEQFTLLGPVWHP